MIRVGTSKDVIDIYEEAGRPLNEEMKKDLAEIDAELKEHGIKCGYVIIELKCRICNYEQTGITPEIADLDNLECDNCGNMAAMEKELNEGGNEDN